MLEQSGDGEVHDSLSVSIDTRAGQITATRQRIEPASQPGQGYAERCRGAAADH